MSDAGFGELRVSLELERLRGEMTTGFAEIKGQLSGIATAQADNAKDIESLEGRVAALEARRWPAASIAMLSGAVSTAVAIAALLIGK